MSKDEMKDKYSTFITKISEILGLGKPVDILKLCATTDLFFRPLEKRIEELEKHNEELLALINAERERQEKCDDVHLRKIAELEKENAELKLKLEALDGQTPWKDIKDKSEVIEKLTEAIELLKKWEDLHLTTSVQAETRQFLKENE